MKPDFILNEKYTESAICYTHEADGTIIRKVSSHQDASYDKISKADYDAEVNVLTGGRKLETIFEDINATKLGTGRRKDTFEEKIISADKVGLGDISFKGTVIIDETAVDDSGNPDPVAVLKPDKGFMYLISYDKAKKVEEIQLTPDVSIKDDVDLFSLEGKTVEVTGASFPANNSHHHRDMILLVREIK